MKIGKLIAAGLLAGLFAGCATPPNTDFMSVRADAANKMTDAYRAAVDFTAQAEKTERPSAPFYHSLQGAENKVACENLKEVLHQIDRAKFRRKELVIGPSHLSYINVSNNCGLGQVITALP